MSPRRSSAVPDLLKLYARRGDEHRGALNRTRERVAASHLQFLLRCEAGPVHVDVPIDAMTTTGSSMRELDAFVKHVGDEFAEADNKALWDGDSSRVSTYGPDGTAEAINDYRPFDHVHTGGPTCRTNTDNGGMITGPDGKEYLLATPRSGDDPTWRTESMAQGPVVQNQVSGGQKVIAAIAGISSPFGAAASPEWYRDEHFRIGRDGRPVVNGTPRGPKATIDDVHAEPDDTTSAVAQAVDLGLTHASAVVDIAHEDDGYYAVRFQVNSKGERRALVGIYKVRSNADGSFMTTSYYTGSGAPIPELDPAYRAKKADEKKRKDAAKSNDN